MCDIEAAITDATDAAVPPWQLKAARRRLETMEALILTLTVSCILTLTLMSMLVGDPNRICDADR